MVIFYFNTTQSPGEKAIFQGAQNLIERVGYTGYKNSYDI